MQWNCRWESSSTLFDCGGIGVGLCISHKIGDALSYFTFLNTWAAVARGDKKKIVLPEFVSAKIFPPLNVSVPEPPSGPTKEIREKYAAENGIRPSRIEALSAFIWSRFIASTKEKPSPNVILHTVNLRTRFDPALPAQCFGNMFHLTRTVPSVDKEKDDGCNNLVSQIETPLEKSTENVRKLQAGDDLSEGAENNISKGESIPFIFTSLCRFPLYEADFGWGKPVWVSSANLSTRNLVVFMDTANGDGVEAWIHLKEGDMAEFASDEECVFSMRCKGEKESIMECLIRKMIN
ncbi:hypothetical protein GQ457_03G008750 [Hibiscus cannabinus]